MVQKETELPSGAAGDEVCLDKPSSGMFQSNTDYSLLAD